MRINKHDTQGTKPLLGKGELGYDDYTAGGDTGRVYVGTGDANVALAKKSEVDAHTSRVDNPHSVTKTQVGLGNVDNTSDVNKPVSTATQTALNNKVDKVTSTDNAIVRFDGTTGQVQNSSVLIDDSGNVGIGVTPSAWRADRKSLDALNASFWGYSTTANVTANAYINSSNAYIYKNTDYATWYNQSNGQHVWNTAPYGTAGSAISWNTAMTLDSNGNLGIGIGSPISPLDVIQKGSDSNNALNLRGYTTGVDGGRIVNINAITSDANNWAVLNNKANSFTWSIKGTGTAMILDANGNLGIGVTPNAWGSNRAIQIGSSATLLSDTSGINSYISLLSNNNNGNFSHNGYSTHYEQYQGAHIWRTSTSSGIAGNTITWNTAMTLDASGNLGIGSASDGAKLAVYGNNNTTAENVFQVGILGVTNGFVISKDSVANPNYKFLTTNGNTVLEIDAYGNTLVKSPFGGLGYGTGAGGTVTQATSKSTPVTLNKPVGIITMNGAALASGGVVTFQVNNYLVSYSDNILITLRDQISGFYNYRAEIAGIYNGYFIIRITNIGGSTLSDGIVINVTVIKGATA